MATTVVPVSSSAQATISETSSALPFLAGPVASYSGGSGFMPVPNTGEGGSCAAGSCWSMVVPPENGAFANAYRFLTACRYLM
ncbi:hypothetical protein GCM10010452_08790 [Crossiella cryophila]